MRAVLAYEVLRPFKLCLRQVGRHWFVEDAEKRKPHILAHHLSKEDAMQDLDKFERWSINPQLALAGS